MKGTKQAVNRHCESPLISGQLSGQLSVLRSWGERQVPWRFRNGVEPFTKFELHTMGLVIIIVILSTWETCWNKVKIRYYEVSTDFWLADMVGKYREGGTNLEVAQPKGAQDALQGTCVYLHTSRTLGPGMFIITCGQVSFWQPTAPVSSTYPQDQTTGSFMYEVNR